MNYTTQCPFCNAQLVCSIDGTNEYAVSCKCNFHYHYFEFKFQTTHNNIGWVFSNRYEFKFKNPSEDTEYIVFGRSHNDIYSINVVVSSKHRSNLTILSLDKSLTLENFYIEFQKYIDMTKNNTLEPFIKKLVMLS
jgi:hypothetical protein